MSDEVLVEEPADGAPKRRGKSKKRHTIGTVLLASVVVLAVVTGLSVAFLYRHLNGNITVSDVMDEIDDRPDKVNTGPKGPINVLVLGSDTRSGEGNQIDGEAGGGVSDTTILLHLSADRTRAYGISIPRDSLVTRPDCGPNNGIPGGEDQMWNAAYALGGEACTVEQFEQNTGIRVDDFVIVDFAGFQDMVDAVDGVPVCIPEDIEDPAHGISIPAGDRVLRGKEALNYVRVRYTLGDGSDIGRIKRQQAFIASMVNKVVSAGTLTRPDRVVGFLNAATESLTVSPGLKNLSKLAKLGLSLNEIGLDNVQFITVPNEYDQREEFRGRVVWSQPDADKLWSKIKHDKPLTKSMSEGSISAAQPPGSKTPTASPTESGTPSSDPSASDSPSDSASPSATPSKSPTKMQGPTEEEIAEAELNGLCA